MPNTGTATFKERASAPSSPTTGKWNLYFKSDGMYFQDDAGVETLIYRIDGWTPAGETLTYSSADDPTYTFTISGDKSSKYTVGMKFKLTQTSVKYFIITAVSYSSGTGITTITVYGGTDYDLANATISDPYFSTHKAPQGFPLDPAKWTVEVTLASQFDQSSPTQNTWYNVSSLNISIPIGSWKWDYNVFGYCERSSSGGCEISTTLSTTNSSESESKNSSCLENYGAYSTIMVIAGSLAAIGFITVTSKTTYYFNIKTFETSISKISLLNANRTGIIRAVCAYL